MPQKTRAQNVMEQTLFRLLLMDFPLLGGLMSTLSKQMMEGSGISTWPDRPHMEPIALKSAAETVVSAAIALDPAKGFRSRGQNALHVVCRPARGARRSYLTG